MLKHTRIFLAVSAFPAMLVSASPVQGQAWIGQVIGNMMAQQQAAAARDACMRGTPMMQSEIDEALPPTTALMQAYFAAMQGGVTPRSRFYQLDSKARWNHGEQSLREAGLGLAGDPFAAPGNVLDAQPSTYFRSGMEAWTLSQWQVHDRSGALAGTYTGLFVRNIGDWKIRELTLTPANEYVEPARQFCFTPGDVLPYREEQSERNRTHWERQVTRAEARVARENQNVVSAERSLAERIDNTSRQRRLDDARAELAEKMAQLAAHQTELAAVLTEQSAVAAELTEITRQREAGIARIQAMR